MIKYPSIEQFKHLVRSVKEKTCYAGKDEEGKAIFVDRPLPTLKFSITEKLHGTNAGIRLDRGAEEIIAQSRERELNLMSDNAGFCAYVTKHRDYFKQVLEKLMLETTDSVVIFGEWAGGNIQSNVAIHGVEKFFAPFSVLRTSGEDREWIHTYLVFPDNVPEYQVYPVHNFYYDVIEIDFESPEKAQNELVEICLAIEEKSRAGVFFGKEGIGEGIVIEHNSQKYGRLTCKIKGEKHTGGKSKVKTLAPIDEAKIDAVKEFVDMYVTEGRLQQGLHVMKAEKQLELIDKNVGEYIRWVVSDVIKEESNSIAENDLDPKKIAKVAGDVARKYYFEKAM